MKNKIVEISNKTDFINLMNDANCETKLHRVSSELDYFKYKDKSTKKWITLVVGDKILVDENYNLIKQ